MSSRRNAPFVLGPTHGGHAIPVFRFSIHLKFKVVEGVTDVGIVPKLDHAPTRRIELQHQVRAPAPHAVQIARANRPTSRMLHVPCGMPSGHVSGSTPVDPRQIVNALPPVEVFVRVRDHVGHDGIIRLVVGGRGDGGAIVLGTAVVVRFEEVLVPKECFGHPRFEIGSEDAGAGVGVYVGVPELGDGGGGGRWLGSGLGSGGGRWLRRRFRRRLRSWFRRRLKCWII
mmetsp:Transcript_19212/g.34701  ORF Transcript_19212/g.34701 Transcript_19212/m.34701 type:complete len:228 (+) Transcript_19212:232-915(+)